MHRAHHQLKTDLLRSLETIQLHEWFQGELESVRQENESLKSQVIKKKRKKLVRSASQFTAGENSAVFSWSNFGSSLGHSHSGLKSSFRSIASARYSFKSSTTFSSSSSIASKSKNENALTYKALNQAKILRWRQRAFLLDISFNPCAGQAKLLKVEHFNRF